MGRSNVPSIVSTGYQFRKPSAAQYQEPRSFIETIRDDLRNDTETWFGTEAISTSTSSSTGVDLSTSTEMHGLGGDRDREAYEYDLEQRRVAGKTQMEHTVRVLSGQGYSVEGEEESHLDMEDA